MVKRTKGYRNRTRKLFSKETRDKGMPPLSYLLKEYEPGDKVTIYINSTIHKGQPHRRYHGRTGTIIGRRGRAYLVSFNIGGKEKIVISRPEHIKSA
ncbi:MAG: 50S ribosomal protein L21e [Candidatus Odinarchaeum yellowstonii]|uniref:Large ribosomal subunit protein eL21 n=1 Tax=Odinarchaeota yellowstonii (strain LCB_4) TaxID=1841599 RepID=A0AAF0D0Y2_ODILC|nr:MAG: 50S ribosomal protein L21e [Candidatus Odinarchaeum yellowstonii]